MQSRARDATTTRRRRPVTAAMSVRSRGNSWPRRRNPARVSAYRILNHDLTELRTVESARRRACIGGLAPPAVCRASGTISEIIKKGVRLLERLPWTRGIVRLFAPRGVRRTPGVLVLVRFLLAGGPGYRRAAACTCSSTWSLTWADSTRPLERDTRPRPTRLPSHSTNSPRVGTYASSTSLPCAQAE